MCDQPSRFVWDCPSFTMETSTSWETPLSWGSRDDCYRRCAWPVGVTKSGSQWLEERENEWLGLRQGTLLKAGEVAGMRRLEVS